MIEPEPGAMFAPYQRRDSNDQRPQPPDALAIEAATAVDLSAIAQLTIAR